MQQVLNLMKLVKTLLNLTQVFDPTRSGMRRSRQTVNALFSLKQNICKLFTDDDDDDLMIIFFPREWYLLKNLPKISVMEVKMN